MFSFSSTRVTGIIHSWTHWGRVTQTCVSKLNVIGSDNGLSPGRRQAINWTNAGILLIGPLGIKFSEIIIEIHAFSFKKMHLKLSSAKRRPFCLGLNVLMEVILIQGDSLMIAPWHCQSYITSLTYWGRNKMADNLQVFKYLSLAPSHDHTKCIYFYFHEDVYLCFLQCVCFPWKRTKNCWVRTLPTLVPPNMSWSPVSGPVDAGSHHIQISRWCNNWKSCW